jgi:hypothetical protein
MMGRTAFNFGDPPNGCALGGCTASWDFASITGCGRLLLPDTALTDA